MSEHRQWLGHVTVSDPWRWMAVELIRDVDLTEDGSEVRRRRPKAIVISVPHKTWPTIRLSAEKAYEIGQALIDASALMEEEQNGDRV